jgi:hypothetical protein
MTSALSYLRTTQKYNHLPAPAPSKKRQPTPAATLKSVYSHHQKKKNEGITAL